MKKLQASASTPPPVDTPLVEGSSPAFSSELTPLRPASPIPAQTHPSAGAAAICQPPLIPDHELIRRIGGGSYGEVWLARSVMGTYRAVKIIHRHNFDHARPFEREFAGIQKFEPISRSHEGLVDLLQVGRNDAAGYFYYVMELADGEEMQNEKCKMKNEAAANPTASDGQPSILNFEFYLLHYRPKTLRSLLHPHQQPSALAPEPTARLPLDECIQLGLSLTNALAYLHGRGLVHRDIKPANIIFVGGVPKLADVGLVAGVDEARSYVGTEGFIPPEGPGSPPADLYSLGIVLYVMSTGKSHQDFPEPLVDLATQPDHARWLEFNAVIHQACCAKVRDRYQTAEKMHADLELLCAGKSVKRLHLVERRLALLTRVGLLTAIVAVLAVGVFYQTYRARKIATQNLVRLYVGNGTSQMNQGALFGSLLSFTEALRLDPGSSKHEESHRTRITSVLRQCPRLVGVFQHEKPVNEAVLSPDDRWLLTGSDDHTAKVWDLATGTTRFSLVHKGAVYSVGYSPDSSLIMTTSTDRVHLWSAATGQELPLPLIRHHAGWSGTHLRFSPDGSKLLTKVDLNTFRIWNTTTGEPMGQPLRHDHEVSFCEFSPDGRLIASVSEDNQARVWDALTGELRFSFLHGGSVNCVAFSPASRVLATASSDLQIWFWDLSSGKPLGTPIEQLNGVESLSWSPEGARLLTQSWDKSVQVWDVESRKPLILPIAHAFKVYSARFNPDGRTITTVSGGNLIQLWDAETGELKAPTLRHSDWREPVVFSSDGRLVVALHGEEVRVWDLGVIEPRPLAIRPVGYFKADSVSPNARFKVIIGADSTVRTINLKSQELLPQLIGLVPPIRQAFFSANSEILITESGDTRVRAWNPAKGEPLTPMLKTEYLLNAAPISPGDLPLAGRLDRPVAELVLLAQLLSGNRIEEAGGFRPLAASESFAGWTNLTAKDPEAFRSSAADVFAWHQQEAKACEQAWNWWSAIFHLNYLLASKPEDASLLDRRKYAQLALEQANQVPGGYLKQTQATPPRPPFARSEMVDLSRYYHRSVREMGLTLPNGLKTFLGTTFDVRGVVELSGLKATARSGSDPEQVAGINIGRKCRRLQFLHATKLAADNGTHVGTYVVHYADTQTREFRIVYGLDLRAWCTENGEPLMAKQAALVWLGSNPLVRSESKSLRMFKSTWVNERPGVEVVSIDFVSSLSAASPFLVAVAAD